MRALILRKCLLRPGVDIAGLAFGGFVAADVVGRGRPARCAHFRHLKLHAESSGEPIIAAPSAHFVHSTPVTTAEPWAATTIIWNVHFSHGETSAPGAGGERHRFKTKATNLRRTERLMRDTQSQISTHSQLISTYFTPRFYSFLRW
jgi:hypothetical protein